jgi:RNA polymerase sigma-70 factor (ECF subfamily)
MKEKLMEYSESSVEKLNFFQDGDESLWQLIIAEYSQWLYNLSLRIVRHSNDAEDIVQETFLQAFRARKQLKDFNSLQGWLRQICLRLCLRKSRFSKTVSLQEVEAFLPDDKSASTTESAASKEELGMVLDGLSKLSQRQRACLTLSVFEDLSIEEISQSLGISNGAVKRYIYEARQTLQKFLKGGVR